MAHKPQSQQEHDRDHDQPSFTAVGDENESHRQRKGKCEHRAHSRAAYAPRKGYDAPRGRACAPVLAHPAQGGSFRVPWPRTGRNWLGQRGLGPAQWGPYAVLRYRLAERVCGKGGC
jgi:hypothetical protein